MASKKNSSDEDSVQVDVYYSKLATPASMRSVYWKFFGFPADKAGRIITREKIICKICQSPIAYNKNTSNLKTHFTSRHKEYASRYLNNVKKPQKFIYRTLDDSDHQDQEDDNIEVEYKIINAKVSTTKTENITLTEDDPSSIKDLIKILSSETETADNHQEEIEVEEEMITGNKYNDDDDGTVGTIIGATKKEHQQHFENVEYLTNVQENDDGNQMDTQHDDDDDEENETVLKEEYVTKSNLSEAIHSNIDQHLTNMLITDLLPIDTIFGKGFQYLFEDKGEITLPTRKLIQENLTTMYHEKQKNSIKWLKMNLAKKHFSLGFDKWKNIQQTEYITVSLNYIDKIQLKSYNICTIPVNQATTIDWSSYFNFLNIKQFCTMAIFNFEPNDIDKMLMKFLSDNNIQHSMCLHYVITKIGLRCFQLSSVQEILKKSFDFLHETETLMILDCEAPADIHEQFWLTKYNFLEFIGDIYMPAFETTDNELQQLHANVTILLECLKPLKVLLETIQMEQNALSSLLKPLIQQLINGNFAANENDDTTVEIEIKQIVVEEFEKHIVGNQILTLTSFLDPRLHNFTSEDDLPYIQNEIKQMCRDLDLNIVEPSAVAKTEKNIKTNDTDSLKNLNRKSGLEFFFSQKVTKPAKQNVSSFEKEFKRFQEDVNEQFGQCPLAWWNDSGYLFPYMKHVAEKFNCIPAMLKPIAGIMADNIVVHDRRTMLYGRYVDERLWLYYNNLNS